MPKQSDAIPNREYFEDTREYIPQYYGKPPFKDLLTWSSPARVFKQHDRELLTTIGSIVFLLCVILIFIKEYLLIIVIMAFGFFWYMMHSVKPDILEHKITTHGIVTAGKLYEWDKLGRFWFETKGEETLLLVEHFGPLPPRLMILLGKLDPKQVSEILDPMLQQEQPEPTSVEKAVVWLQKKVPLETSFQAKKTSKK